MKVLIISDSHLYNNYLENVVNRYKQKVDVMIHCGDSSLEHDNPLIKTFQIVVKGNHDDAPYPIYQIYQNICITHGHYFHIYEGYDDLVRLCLMNKCLICLHGHTHVPTHQVYQGIHFINPGSLMMNRGSYGYGTYAILEITKNHLTVDFYHHITHKICDQSILDEGLLLLDEFKKYI